MRDYTDDELYDMMRDLDLVINRTRLQLSGLRDGRRHQSLSLHYAWLCLVQNDYYQRRHYPLRWRRRIEEKVEEDVEKYTPMTL